MYNIRVRVRIMIRVRNRKLIFVLLDVTFCINFSMGKTDPAQVPHLTVSRNRFYRQNGTSLKHGLYKLKPVVEPMYSGPLAIDFAMKDPE